MFKELFKSIVTNREEWLQDILHGDSITPRIKGQVTPGKLRWRGIRLCSNRATDYVREDDKQVVVTLEWVEQRGVVLGPMLVNEIVVHS